jgi:2-hydroxycyclohexanecarboxyl-CoA dehydrogenase
MRSGPSLAGRSAFVTGAGSGIGRAIALRLASGGADVAVVDLDRERAQEVSRAVQSTGRRSVAVDVDVASFTAVAAAAGRVRSELGPIHILVHSAGIGGRDRFPEMTEEVWDRMIAVHLKGAFNCTRSVIADMLAAGWGRIIQISSIAALRGGEGLAHYASAKAGIIGFTKALAQEVGRSGVTVNAIACGLIDTPMVRQSARAEAFIQETARSIPVGRIGQPQDIAAACAYLVSEEASFVTGQVLSPNGGAYM